MTQIVEPNRRGPDYSSSGSNVRFTTLIEFWTEGSVEPH